MMKTLLLSFVIGNACLFSVAFAQEPAPATPMKSQAQIAASEAMEKDAACIKCHDEQKPMNIFRRRHGVKGDARTPQCISCHGESAAHVEGTIDPNDPEKKKRMPVDVVFKKGEYKPSEAGRQNASCLTCHEKDHNRRQWDTGAHAINKVACVACHTVHNPVDKVQDRKTQTEVCFSCHKDQRAESNKISHHAMREGKVTCSDCHNTHGSSGPKMLKKATVNETCFTCHAEKRGPFLWEHQPVTENCMTCHTAHGSNVTPLLKSRAPFQCQECHDGPHQSATPAGRNAGGRQAGLPTVTAVNAGAAGRSCTNCHSMIHGSNHPAGSHFIR